MKHMRYATEFFGGLFDPKSAERYAERAAALQDLLGALNDASVAVRLVEARGPAKDTRTSYAAGVVTGWCACESEGDAEALKRAWRGVRQARPFWRDGKYRAGASA